MTDVAASTRSGPGSECGSDDEWIADADVLGGRCGRVLPPDTPIGWGGRVVTRDLPRSAHWVAARI